MIPFSQIDRTPGHSEVIYTWQCDRTLRTRSWAVDRLQRWCEASGKDVLAAEVKPDMANFYMENRGIEMHRLERLMGSVEAMLAPCIMLREPGTPEDPNHDYMLAGHHRYVALHIVGINRFRLWLLSPEEAEPFEIEGDVIPPGSVLDPEVYSGL